MGKILLKAFVLFSVLAAVIWIASCGVNPSSNNSNNSVAKPCSSIKEVQDRVDEAITKAKLVRHTTDSKPVMAAKVYPDGSKYVLVIEGYISDGKSGSLTENAEYMEIFMKELDEYVLPGCIFRIVFAPKGTIADLDEKRLLFKDLKGFEWSSCDWPKVSCPGGCADYPCSTKITGQPDGDKNSNSNSDANSKANANSSTNSNTNNP